MKKSLTIAGLKDIISSRDKDSLYLAASILRVGNHSFSSRTVQTYLKKIPILDRIREYSDICEELGIKELTLEDYNFLPEDQRVCSLALHKLLNIAKFFNQGWIAHFNNSNQKKWFPWHEKTTSGLGFHYVHYVSDSSALPAGLYLESEEKAKQCGELFPQVYKDYLN